MKESYQPNYFHEFHSFSGSLYQNTGANIMQLEPQEDNRDAFDCNGIFIFLAIGGFVCLSWFVLLYLVLKVEFFILKSTIM
ncbi:hypothetical protein ACFQ3N_11250 [Virgibacillus byunsanensis]|uniref:Uncharacterized protein n=1 Tax=Virgibacillus byunsanensis TaxID=570945 RepID=A0ABW3LM02_9BACI